MLTTVECLSLLREYMRKNAAKYGISRMGIFGSVARGEQHEGSDVDICVEIDRPSIFTLVHIKEERSEEHTSELHHKTESRMPSSA